MKRAAPKSAIVANLSKSVKLTFLRRRLFKRPLLTFGVCGVPVLAALLPAFLSDPRDLVFGGFLAGCLMCVIVFKKR